MFDLAAYRRVPTTWLCRDRTITRSGFGIVVMKQAIFTSITDRPLKLSSSLPMERYSSPPVSCNNKNGQPKFGAFLNPVILVYLNGLVRVFELNTVSD